METNSRPYTPSSTDEQERFASAATSAVAWLEQHPLARASDAVNAAASKFKVPSNPLAVEVYRRVLKIRKGEETS